MKSLIGYALLFVGTPYIWGGDDPTGFDCSGFVQELLASVGIDPAGDQSSNGLYRHFKKDGFQLDFPLPGSLCFYGSENKITHVAFSIDNFRVVEAAGGNANTKTLEDAARQNAYVRVRPYDRRSDLIAIILPHYHLEGH